MFGQKMKVCNSVYTSLSKIVGSWMNCLCRTSATLSSKSHNSGYTRVKGPFLKVLHLTIRRMITKQNSFLQKNKKYFVMHFFSFVMHAKLNKKFLFDKKPKKVEKSQTSFLARKFKLLPHSKYTFVGIS